MHGFFSNSGTDGGSSTKTDLKTQLLKTGATFGIVYGTAHVIEKIRKKAPRDPPVLDNAEFLEGHLEILQQDYAFILALHRIFLIIKRNEYDKGENWHVFYTASRASCDFFRACLLNENVKETNASLRRAEKKIDKLKGVVLARDFQLKEVVSEDTETLKACLSAHLQNLFVDTFF